MPQNTLFRIRFVHVLFRKQMLRVARCQRPKTRSVEVCRSRGARSASVTSGKVRGQPGDSTLSVAVNCSKCRPHPDHPADYTNQQSMRPHYGGSHTVNIPVLAQVIWTWNTLMRLLAESTGSHMSIRKRVGSLLLAMISSRPWS